MSQPLTVDTLWQLQRLGAIALSPDGRQAVCTVTACDMDANRGRTALWLLDTTGARAPRRLTTAPGRHAQPAWSPRGDRIAFIGQREQQGKKDEAPQLYLIAADGGEAVRASDFAPGIEAFRWLPDGRGLICSSWVWPDERGAAAQARRWQTEAKRKSTGYVTEEADYRLWDHHHPMGRVLHLLHLDLSKPGVGRVRDLFEGSAHELPRDDPTPEPFDVSPDGRRVAFAFDPAAEKRGGNRLALAEIELATRRVRMLADHADWRFELPRYAPEGQRLAMLAAHVGVAHTMPARPALLTLGRRQPHWRPLGTAWDHEAGSAPRWSADGRALLLTAEAEGRCHLWRCTFGDDDDSDGDGSFTLEQAGGWVQGFDIAGAGASEVVLTLRDSHAHPPQVHAARAGAAPRRLERFNDRALARVALGRTEAVSVTGALGQPVQLWLTFPPGFDARRRHAVTHVIHGGPYTAAGDTWSWRWNAHVLASQGHVVAQVNYHGSSGFGHAFKHSIMGRLGALEYQDIEAATDWLLAQRWTDPQRVFATGGSYGGFMVAWLNGRAAPGRYRALVCHAGVFDRVATFAADSWASRRKDLGTWYWEDLAAVHAQSPHALAATMHTPTLVIHGAQDYRVPDGNGLAFYNTLKARGVPARLLWFPDENHWVLKPQNSRLWYGEVLGWLQRHGRPQRQPRPAATAGRRAPASRGRT